MLGIFIGLGLIIAILVIFVLPGIFTVGANEVGILTRKMTGKKLAEGRVVARNGENGLQAATLKPGIYWKFWVFWSWTKVKVTVIPPGQIGIVESIDGVPLPAHRILADSKDSNSYQDAVKFLENGGYRGVQIEILRPGTYRINTKVFSVDVKPATFIDKNKVGVAVAADGISLPNGYIVAPEGAEAATHDSKHYQDGQAFIDGGGYRGAQLETLQPGEYYINPALFLIQAYDVQDVPPGYVAILRSNVGLELDRDIGTPKDANTPPAMNEGAIHADIENILIPSRNKRGIWREPVAPGKYNLNQIAFTPYLVPTSAVTIDWASEGHIGTDVQGVPDKGVLFKFDPLRVTSQDGFQLDVNVRMVIRIKPENAAYIIARFGSVSNLIDQIVHPLIDSSFRNKAGEKKAIEFFQSRTTLQSDALAHAKSVFEEYNVEAQNLLVAYIDIPESLLATQTAKEIALQQQAQYVEQAKAQEENIAVQEKTARAEKQKDVIAAKLQIDINTDLADAAAKQADGVRRARIAQAEGDAAYTRMTGEAQGDANKAIGEGEGAAQKAIGEGKAAGYKAQTDAMGQENTALVNILSSLGDNKLQLVPQVMITSGNEGGGGLSNVLNLLAVKLGKEISNKELAAPKEKP